MLKGIEYIIQSIGYVGIALLMFLENIFPFIPSEIIMLLAGFLTAKEQLSYIAIVFSAVLGSLAGSSLFYLIGYKVSGEQQLIRWADEHGHWLMLSAKDIKRGQSFFNHHGRTAVLLCMLIPDFRTIMSLASGVNHMNFLNFFLISMAGTTVWIGILTYLGQTLGKNYNAIGRYMNPISYAVIGGLLLWYLIYMIRHKGGKKS